MHIFKNTNYDFLKWKWHALGLSGLSPVQMKELLRDGR